MSTNWRVCIRENARAPERGSVWRELADDSGVFIAQTYEPYAEFIVRACNSHDEMVAALKLCEEKMPYTSCCPGWSGVGNHNEDCLVGRALAKAKS